MDRSIIGSMTIGELRLLATRQAELISEYEEMVFFKDKLIRNLESSYEARTSMEEARIKYDIKMVELRQASESIYKRLEGLAVECCEAKKDGDGDAG